MLKFISYLCLLLSAALFLPSCSSSRKVANGKLGNVVGVPAKRLLKSELVVNHTDYSLAYSKKYGQPLWVAWVLSYEEISGKTKRAAAFLPDPAIPEKYRVTTDDYKGSGYSRGHQSPAADNKKDSIVMSECMYMSNMCPQTQKLNGGVWNDLEDSCRVWAWKNDSIFIVSGPVFYDKPAKWIGKTHKIAVPDAFFKVILSYRAGHNKALGFIFRNDDSKQQLQDGLMTVDEVEKITGYNFFPKLRKSKQKALESNAKLEDWY